LPLRQRLLNRCEPAPFKLQTFHSAIGCHLAGRREILRSPLDHNSTTHERILIAGQQSLIAMPPPMGIQTLTGIGDQSHLDWSAIIYLEGDWRHCVQLRPGILAVLTLGIRSEDISNCIRTVKYSTYRNPFVRTSLSSFKTYESLQRRLTGNAKHLPQPTAKFFRPGTCCDLTTIDPNYKIPTILLHNPT
jgi:hypothetical protein